MDPDAGRYFELRQRLRKSLCEQQGVNLFEVQGSDARLLFSQDTRVKELGTKILRDFLSSIPYYQGDGGGGAGLRANPS